jgi:uncharacterized membrane protein YcaP (DUF421 family)
LRSKDVLELDTVQYAILETNGDLSVFLYPNHRPATAGEAGITTRDQSLPVTVIEDGKLLQGNLPHAGKTRAWVNKILRQNKTTVKNTFLLTVDGNGQTLFIPKKEHP